METSKRLVPYSIHLPEEVYLALKEQAKYRQASSLVRDAITSMLSGSKPFNSGYNQALRDVIKLLKKHDVASVIAWNGVLVSDDLAEQIDQLQKT